MTLLSRRHTLSLLGLLALGTLSVAACSGTRQAQAQAHHSTHPPGRPWMDTSLSPGRRADMLLAQMTLDEKIAMVHGVANAAGIAPVDYAGYVPANTRLGIPALYLEDGPGGVGEGQQNVTAFPVPLATAASWDPALAQQFGAALGAEESAKGANVVLGPTVNVVRDPRWGRSYETFGEDPYLSTIMGDEVIAGIQSKGLIAEVKHFAAYAQETARLTGGVTLSDRALHEVYLPPFESAVTADNVGAVMTAYNQVDGTFAGENADLLTTVLERAWGFTGFTTSDWFGTHSTIAAADAGLDIEMPDGKYFGAPLAQAVKTGQVSMATLDAMVRAILTTMFRFGYFDRPATGAFNAVATSDAHMALARSIEEESSVLLKNDGNLLPLPATALRSIAVIEPPVSAPPPPGASGNEPSVATKFGGCGSASVAPSGVVSIAAGITTRAGAGVSVTVGNSGDTAQAAATASGADAAIVVVHDEGCEDTGPLSMAAQGSSVADRATLALPGNQDQLVEAVAAANPHTVVVLETQGPVTMPWLPHVPAVLEAWYGGQQIGNAVAAILFGDADPSGKLPETFPTGDASMPTSDPSAFPGTGGLSTFSEGIDVGYRYYESAHVPVAFPFGFGMSYTSFSVSKMEAFGTVASGAIPDGTPTANSYPGSGSGSVNTTVPKGRGSGAVTMRVTLTNTGRGPGADVVQVYVGDPSSTGEPVRQLVGFERVELAPGATSTVSFVIPARALAWWDTTSHEWSVSPGTYTLMAGDSSESIATSTTIAVR